MAKAEKTQRVVVEITSLTDEYITAAMARQIVEKALGCYRSKVYELTTRRYSSIILAAEARGEARGARKK